MQEETISFFRLVEETKETTFLPMHSLHLHFIQMYVLGIFFSPDEEFRFETVSPRRGSKNRASCNSCFAVPRTGDRGRDKLGIDVDE